MTMGEVCAVGAGRSPPERPARPWGDNRYLPSRVLPPGGRYDRTGLCPHSPCQEPAAPVRRLFRWSLGAVAPGVLLLAGLAAYGATPIGRPLFVGMGDSLGEGVQSDDANECTQPFLGISGDRDERLPSSAAADMDGFFRRYQQLAGIDLRTESRRARIDAMRELFGLRALMPEQRPRAAGSAWMQARHGIGYRAYQTPKLPSPGGRARP